MSQVLAPLLLQSLQVQVQLSQQGTLGLVKWLGAVLPPITALRSILEHILDLDALVVLDLARVLLQLVEAVALTLLLRPVAPLDLVLESGEGTAALALHLAKALLELALHGLRAAKQEGLVFSCEPGARSAVRRQLRDLPTHRRNLLLQSLIALLLQHGDLLVHYCHLVFEFTEALIK